MSSTKDCLAGKTALITGGAVRIGRAISLALAEAGINVIIHHLHSSAEARETVSQAKKQGVKAWTIQADFSKLSQTEKLISRSLKKAGTIDFLINNASVFPPSHLPDVSAQDISRVLQINTICPLILSRDLTRYMPQGVIINLLDCRIAEYDLNHAAYQLSKNMLYDLTRMMSIQFAPRFRVNGVAPGLILPSSGQKKASLKKLFYRNLLHGSGKPTDIAKAVLFLCKSSFITGEVIFVDGGQHLKGSTYEKAGRRQR